MYFGSSTLRAVSTHKTDRVRDKGLPFDKICDCLTASHRDVNLVRVGLFASPFPGVVNVQVAAAFFVPLYSSSPCGIRRVVAH
jgi:uncharacterized membrane protein YiaA